MRQHQERQGVAGPHKMRSDFGAAVTVLPDKTLHERLRDCRLCAERFAKTATAHAPRPVVWFQPGARLLIAGQAPGLRVHASGRPFTDPSGDRLRDWLGLDEQAFYDQTRVAIVPMAFCFPGYDHTGADLPPPSLCARTWRREVMDHLPGIELVLAIGGSAIRWHLGQTSVSACVRDWRDWHQRTGVFPLPHPSWRNTGWLKKNPWFADEVLPELRARVRRVMETDNGR